MKEQYELNGKLRELLIETLEEMIDVGCTNKDFLQQIEWMHKDSLYKSPEQSRGCWISVSNSIVNMLSEMNQVGLADARPMIEVWNKGVEKSEEILKSEE